jgi:CMP-N,N'-diacetyllegionaminic acid synthase
MTSVANDIAIIPGKALSLRIKDKNIVDVGGKPLIYFSISSALKVFSEVVVSTDSPKIAAISTGLGAKVVAHPTGDVGATNVVIDALENKLNRNHYDSVFMLQATSPFRSEKTLRSALYAYREAKDDTPLTLISVVNANKRCTYMDIGTTYKKRNFIVPQFTDKPATSPDSYRVNGAIFGTTVENLLRRREFAKDVWSLPFEMSQIESIEIDTEDDLALARLVAKGML